MSPKFSNHFEMIRQLKKSVAFTSFARIDKGMEIVIYGIGERGWTIEIQQEI